MIIAYPIPQNHKQDKALPFDCDGVVLRMSDRPESVEGFFRVALPGSRMAIVVDYDELDSVTDLYHQATRDLVRWRELAVKCEVVLVIAAHTEREHYGTVGYNLLTRHADVTYEPIKCLRPEMARQVYDVRAAVKKGSPC